MWQSLRKQVMWAHDFAYFFNLSEFITLYSNMLWQWSFQYLIQTYLVLQCRLQNENILFHDPHALFLQAQSHIWCYRKLYGTANLKWKLVMDMDTQDNCVCTIIIFYSGLLIKILTYHHSYLLVATLGFASFFHNGLFGGHTLFLQLGCFWIRLFSTLVYKVY